MDRHELAALVRSRGLDYVKSVFSGAGVGPALNEGVDATDWYYKMGNGALLFYRCAHTSEDDAVTEIAFGDILDEVRACELLASARWHLYNAARRPQAEAAKRRLREIEDELVAAGSIPQRQGLSNGQLLSARIIYRPRGNAPVTEAVLVVNAGEERRAEFETVAAREAYPSVVVMMRMTDVSAAHR